MTEASEQELIARARSGDETAVTLLVRQHQDAVFRLAYLLTGDTGDADDIAQETFIHAFRALHRVDDTRPLRPYLLRITTNLARNRWRSIRRYMTMVQRVARHDDERARRHDDRRLEADALRQAVARLDRADQEVIYLRFFLDMPVDETAAALGVAPGTVKSRLHRALGRLRAVVLKDFPVLWEDASHE